MKGHPPCAPTEMKGSANKCSRLGVNVPAQGDAEDDVVGGEGKFSAWSRKKK
jgi:hypothetical protein